MSTSGYGISTPATYIRRRGPREVWQTAPVWKATFPFSNAKPGRSTARLSGTNKTSHPRGSNPERNHRVEQSNYFSAEIVRIRYCARREITALLKWGYFLGENSAAIHGRLAGPRSGDTGICADCARHNNVISTCSRCRKSGGLTVRCGTCTKLGSAHPAGVPAVGCQV